MSEYIVNPRRAPRAPTRCHVDVHAKGAVWESQTEDVSAHGCQLVAPAPLARDTAVGLVLATPSVPEPLHVAARVAWSGSRSPWRIGLAFDQGSRAAASRWFEQLLAANPGLGNFRRVPDRLPVDAMVFLGPPPRFPDVSHDDLEVLRRVGNGVTILALRRRLQESWPTSQRILFALLMRGLLTLSRGAGAHPEAWRRIMTDSGAAAPEEPARTPPTLARTPQPMPAVVLPTPVPAQAPPAPVVEPRSAGVVSIWSPLAVARVTPPPLPSVTPPPLPIPERRAGTGWRGATQRRTAEAQEAFDLGRAELAEGRTKAALALLRRALQLAPGDAEVASELGRAMRG